jgi:hypothetical protein
MKNIFNKVSLTFAMLLVAYGAMAQSYFMQEVIYLNNGSIIKGLIVEEMPGKSYVIKTSDNNIVVCDYADVLKITREVPAETAKTSTGPSDAEQQSPKKTSLLLGCSLYGEMNSDNNYGSTGIEAIIDYKTTPYITTGLGIGIDGYDGLKWMPIFAEIKVDLGESKSRPFIYGKCGYIAPMENYNDYREYNGGLLMGAGLGLKSQIGAHTSLVFKLGYKYMAINYNEYVYAMPLGVETGKMNGELPYPYSYWGPYSMNNHAHFISLSMGISF